MGDNSNIFNKITKALSRRKDFNKYYTRLGVAFEVVSVLTDSISLTDFINMTIAKNKRAGKSKRGRKPKSEVSALEKNDMFVVVKIISAGKEFKEYLEPGDFVVIKRSGDFVSLDKEHRVFVGTPEELSYSFVINLGKDFKF